MAFGSLPSRPFFARPHPHELRCPTVQEPSSAWTCGPSQRGRAGYLANGASPQGRRLASLAGNYVFPTESVWASELLSPMTVGIR